MPKAKGAVIISISAAILSRLAVGAASVHQWTAQPPLAGIEIDAGRVESRISPLLYGQFIEFMFEGIKRGLHAELIRNRSFEEEPGAIGISRYWERYPDDRNDDYAISFSWDAGAAYPPTSGSERPETRHSLRVQLRSGVVARHGVYQSRVAVRQGLEYRGYLWIRSDAFIGGITVALEADVTGGAVYDEARITNITGGWKKYPFRLQPQATDPLARFAILFAGSGTVWVDQVSLMPADAVDEVRADVFERVKALSPAFIRWPGGNVAQDYHWQWGIGPRDGRPSWINLSWKNEIEAGDFGTDEFIRFSRAAGAEPSITVNVEGRGATADEAAAWVDYCNGPASSRYGALRARNGHFEPYGVRYWEIGNEIWGEWVRGHTDAATYARHLTRYVAAMRQVDPSIKVIAVGDNDMTWNRTVLRLAGERLDYLAVHHYYSQRDMDGDLRNLMAHPLRYERFYGEMDVALRELAADRRPRLAINEWGLDVPESLQYSIIAALYGARLMNVFERRSDLVAMSAVSDLVNGWPGGIIQAGSHGVFVTPIYLVNKLYATHLGAERLAANVHGPTFASSREASAVPVLDAVASRSPDGRTIFIKAVNSDLERPLPVQIGVRGVQVSANAIVEQVAADSLNAVNGFATPEAVRITQSDVRAGNRFSLELPRHSVSVITLATVR
jgi:alpha-N-arabinofuranosidase